MTRAIVIKSAGDPDIAGAIMEGMKAAHAGRAATKVDQQVQRHLLRVAVGNNKTPDDYASLSAKARFDYGQDVRQIGLWPTVLGVWALVWLLIFGAVAYLQAWNRGA